jgi:hypothetical protein
MANLVSLPYNFQPNTLAQSAQVDANFNSLLSYINAGIGTFTGNGYWVGPGGIYIQWGTVTGVKADGSGASAVTFSTTFPTAVFGLVATVENAFQSNPWGLTVQWDTPTVSGFNLNVGGAPASSTTSVFWIAIGN